MKTSDTGTLLAQGIGLLYHTLTWLRYLRVEGREFSEILWHNATFAGTATMQTLGLIPPISGQRAIRWFRSHEQLADYWPRTWQSHPCA
jgi:hypothetical protein